MEKGKKGIETNSWTLHLSTYYQGRVSRVSIMSEYLDGMGNCLFGGFVTVTSKSRSLGRI